MTWYELKVALKEFSTRTKSTSFPLKMFKALANLDYGKEKLVYKHLLKTIPVNELADVAATTMPYDILWSVSNQFYQEVLQTYPIAKKVKFFLSIDEEQKNKLLDASSPTGTASRQMIDMELKTIQDNPIELKRCHLQKNIHVTDFMAFMREHVKNNQALKSEVRLAALEWLNKMQANEGTLLKNVA